MSRFLLLLALFLSLVVVKAQRPALPACSIKCILSAFNQTGESVENSKALCNNILNADVADIIAPCTRASCSQADQIALFLELSKQCNGITGPSRRHLVQSVAWILLVVSGMAVGLRMFSRIFLSRAAGWDDYTVLISYAAVFTITILLTYAKIGDHIWNLPPARLSFVVETSWIAQILYAISISLARISMVLLYLRVFVDSTFMKACYATIACLVIWIVTFIVVTCLECHPLTALLDYDVKNVKCIDSEAAIYAFAAVGILQDVMIIALPVPSLLRLNVTKKRRNHIMLMFSLGIFTLVATCIRFRYIIGLSKYADRTFAEVPALIWSLVEIDVGIICASMPAMKALAYKMFPQYFTTFHDDPRPTPTYPQTPASDNTKTGKSERYGWPAEMPADSAGKTGTELMMRSEYANAIMDVEHGRTEEANLCNHCRDGSVGGFQERTSHFWHGWESEHRKDDGFCDGCGELFEAEHGEI